MKKIILFILINYCLVFQSCNSTPPKISTLPIINGKNIISIDHSTNIIETMEYLGSPLPYEVITQLNNLSQHSDSLLQSILDPYALAMVSINENHKVSVTQGKPFQPLVQSGWANYLVKILNKAKFTGRLEVRSPNSEPLFDISTTEEKMHPDDFYTQTELEERFLELYFYRNAPLKPNLSGDTVEYVILQVYCKNEGYIKADIDFYIGDYYENITVIDSIFLKPSLESDAIGLRGEYFQNKDFSGEPSLTRLDETINFDWGAGTPSDKIETEKFSVRWTSFLTPTKTAKYQIGVKSNDGTRLYLDDELIVANWGLHGPRLRTADVSLTKGKSYAITFEYFEGGGTANVQLLWGSGNLDPARVRLNAHAQPAIPVVFHVKDDDGSPTLASFTITDGIERHEETEYHDILRSDDYRLHAEREYEYYPENLEGLYPLPSRRLSRLDDYPDFYFQSQIYRGDGEHVMLPPGKYNITYTRGPEYISKTKSLIVSQQSDSIHTSFQLDRWVDMQKMDYYSSDSHIHAAGCAFYTNPEEGVSPEEIWRLQLGEDLRVTNVLNWGPNWYVQKEHFSGRDHPAADHNHIMRYNVEISGFPSSHAGHIVLLGLNEDDYPGTTIIDEWPTWNLPILKWAKSQNAITGYAHSGWGLDPIKATENLPNYVLPRMDDIGANEYIVTVTEGVVDFYSVGDTPFPWELNMWYHTLNCGFRPRLSGETDFPCIYDERVGDARSYIKIDGELTYEKYMNGILDGNGYVSDGRSHVIDFIINDQELGDTESEIHLSKRDDLTISAKVSALLPEEQSQIGASISTSSYSTKPYWHVERARLENLQDIEVELIVNGIAVEKQTITANGQWTNIYFNTKLEQSSWVALRIYQALHTNPFFVMIEDKPIRVKESAEWCRASVDQCWHMKKDQISPEEIQDAKQAFDRARITYDKIIEEVEDAY